MNMCRRILKNPTKTNKESYYISTHQIHGYKISHQVRENTNQADKSTNTTHVKNSYLYLISPVKIFSRIDGITLKHEINTNKLIVIMLDDSSELFDFDINDNVGKVFVRICEYLELTEMDYFGLQFIDMNNCKQWLLLDKPVVNQLKGFLNCVFLAVKFYPPSVKSIKCDFTRYLFCLQIRHDILESRLPCSKHVAKILASYVLQSELGNINQDDQFLNDIIPMYTKLSGMSPQMADFNYIMVAEMLSMYGVHMYIAKDRDHLTVNVGVSSSGICVYKDKLRLNRFYWAKIIRLSYQRCRFTIRVSNDILETREKNIHFRLSDHHSAKRLWKMATEHHAFFQLKQHEDARYRSNLVCFTAPSQFNFARTLYELEKLESNFTNFSRSNIKRIVNTCSVDVIKTQSALYKSTDFKRFSSCCEFNGRNNESTQLVEAYALKQNCPFDLNNTTMIDETNEDSESSICNHSSVDEYANKSPSLNEIMQRSEYINHWQKNKRIFHNEHMDSPNFNITCMYDAIKAVTKDLV
ncbi:hypothetical protein GJ496_002462 [Pomphorhynchus laevis]|nr:hypothetical protein GJ496_002462 [Pomphorhynchus laevis]